MDNFFSGLNKLLSDPASAHLHLKQQRMLISKVFPPANSLEGSETLTCLYQKRTKEETLLEAMNEWEERPDKLQIDAICGSSASG